MVRSGCGRGDSPPRFEVARMPIPHGGDDCALETGDVFLVLLIRLIASIRGDSRDVPDPAAVPAGWYPDPADLPQHRFWDGTVWTEHTAPAGAPAPAAAPEPS